MSSCLKIGRWLVLAAGLIAAGGAFGPAVAYKLKVLHAFCASGPCSDGRLPAGAPVPDGHGNLFGVTTDGGNDQDAGTIYELTPKKRGKWTFHTVHVFCTQAACADGGFPVGGLIADTQGNLYGTTHSGGAHNGGMAFMFTPKSKSGGTFKVLYDFCAQTNCTDGVAGKSRLTYAGDAAGAPYDGVSPLYGSSVGGGGYGTVYQLVPGKPWKESVLYTFCPADNCACGDFPQNLIEDANGNLFGEAQPPGGFDNPNLGTVFELSPTGGGSWTETTLFQFCPGNSHCPDGVPGTGPMVVDASGHLLDVGPSGGSSSVCPFGSGGCGDLFEVTPNGVNSTLSVLYGFCEKADCKDGLFPAGLTLDHATASIFGVTGEGGGNDGDPMGEGGGTIFRIVNGKPKVLHAFCAQQGCTDGAYPNSGLTVDASGAVFGTTSEGGGGSGGTVFELVP